MGPLLWASHDAVPFQCRFLIPHLVRAEVGPILAKNYR